MSFVLAGALGGLGEGLQTVGKQRREDWLREQKRLEKIAEEERQARLSEAGRSTGGGRSSGGSRGSSGGSRGLGQPNPGYELSGYLAADIEQIAASDEVDLPRSFVPAINQEVVRLVRSGVEEQEAVRMAFQAVTPVTEEYQLRDNRGLIGRTVDNVQERFFGAEPYEPETRERETGDYRFQYGDEAPAAAAPAASAPRGLGPAPEVMAQVQPPTPPATPQGPGVANGNLPRPRTQAEVDALPSGTLFIAPDGSQRVKP